MLCAQDAAVNSASGPMRILEPVRLTNVLKDKKSGKTSQALLAEISETRSVLERFTKGGYGHAIWAVERLPADPEHIAPWVAECRKAFPGKLILALDTAPTTNFLATKSGELFLNAALPHCESVLVNYTRLDNYHCKANVAKASGVVRVNIAAVRKAAPRKFIWLLVNDMWSDQELVNLRPPEDDTARVAGIRSWVGELGALVDGFMLRRMHSLITARYPEKVTCAEEAALLKTGKPVLRGGLIMVCPTLRPGIEKDIMERYARRVAEYEKWIGKRKYAGYTRTLGPEIPSGMIEQAGLLVTKSQ